MIAAGYDWFAMSARPAADGFQRLLGILLVGKSWFLLVGSFWQKKD
jgi:hypothetical protein